MPNNETEESLNSKKDSLLAMFSAGEPKWNLEVMRQMMAETFYLQRTDINNGRVVLELVQDWPFLFHFQGMKAHMNNLMAIDLEELKVTTKVKRVLAFMMKQDFSKHSISIREQVNFVIQDMTKPHQNQTDLSLPASILMLMSYFSEVYEGLFLEVDVSINDDFS